VERLLLVVSDRFVLKNGTVIVCPDMEFNVPSASVPVLLRRPDGSELSTRAEIRTPLVGGRSGQLHGPFQVCTFFGLTKEEIPLGTEVWLITGTAEIAIGSANPQ
jgi:hypothetical protein